MDDAAESYELPAILIKEPGGRLTPLQVEHLRFLYTRTLILKDDICVMVDIEMSTLDRLIQQHRWPRRQPRQRSLIHRVYHDR